MNQQTTCIRGNFMSWSLKRFTYDMIEEIADNPSRYDSGDLKRAIGDAYEHYKDEDYNCSYAWYEQVKRICNAELSSRGEHTI